MSTGPKSYLLLLAFFGTAAIALILPKDELSWRSVTAAVANRSVPTVYVFGNSVVNGNSICDRDKSSITDFLHDVGGRRNINLSQRGQPMEIALNNAVWINELTSESDIILNISLFHFNSSKENDFWSSVVYYLTNGSLRLNSLEARFNSGTPISGEIPLSALPFTYKGVDYPGYAKLLSSFYAREKAAVKCPSAVGVDRAFIEANYWKAYLLPPIVEEYFDDLRFVQEQGIRRGNRISYVLLPIDFEDIDGLDMNLGSGIRARLSLVRETLRSHGVHFLDLAEGLPASAFADRFCACGHLAMEGREFVASAIIKSIQE